MVQVNIQTLSEMGLVVGFGACVWWMSDLAHGAIAPGAITTLGVVIGWLSCVVYAYCRGDGA